MSYREILPAPPLRATVAAYWCVEGVAPVDPRRVLPDGCADLICDFSALRPRARWVGTMTRAIQVHARGRQDVFGIRFAPGGLFPLLGAPLSPLTDGGVDLGALPAAHWRPPLEQWQDDDDFSARCKRADVSLLAALSDTSRPILPGLLLATQTAPELPTVRMLAEWSGLSPRTLERRFMTQLGVSPRQHLRFLRFERALRLLETDGMPAGEAAMAAGFSDQAHLVREFRRFTGTTPGRWR